MSKRIDSRTPIESGKVLDHLLGIITEVGDSVSAIPDADTHPQGADISALLSGLMLIGMTADLCIRTVRSLSKMPGPGAEAEEAKNG